NNRYFDVNVAFAKQSDEDVFIRINVTNRYTERADITFLPTLWFSKQQASNEIAAKPSIKYRNKNSVIAQYENWGEYYFYFHQPDDLLFTNNETNLERITGEPNKSIFVKDAFHDAIIHNKNKKALRNVKQGTKCSPVYQLSVAGGETKTIYCRLSNAEIKNAFEVGFEDIFSLRKKEADEFYNAVLPQAKSDDWKNIQRQALAGLLWSKQYYRFDIENWLYSGDGITEANENKMGGRNSDWLHLKNSDIISMPDKWEYPWYAAWDLAFQCIAFAKVDAVFAKHQLLLMMREWYMKPDGQLPAYEWNFSDVNPPVHAWAALQVYNIEKEQKGEGDIVFLKKIFQKLIINFTWWMNRKDRKGNNIFDGGFLGLDNIGVFNRSLPGNDTQLEQADATSWMGMYALNMLDIALEISVIDPSFEDTATRFFEHFIMIAESINKHHLWSDTDKFFYDVLSVLGSEPQRLEVKSIVGLTSLFAVSILDKKKLEKLTDFWKRINHFEQYRKTNNKYWPNEERDGSDGILLSLVRPEKLVHLLERMLDENEFLSDGGIRALSKYHKNNPYTVNIHDTEYTITYDPGDSISDMFGGNSNWRGPVWMPMNYLFIQSVRKYGEWYGDALKVEFPTRSGNWINLCEVADELTKRVISLFEKDANGNRKYNHHHNWFYNQQGNENLILFYEYFHGDDGRGLGANHQTGWTALIADLIGEQSKIKT
ncbi:MAG: glucosidase, partial [Bacteroidota bacterium]|nr:glucosidase [Bacteroidota bacterium]